MTKVLVCFLAGIGAGLETGFAGMSMAAVISPMLLTFLHMPVYQAVGTSVFIMTFTVLASALSHFAIGGTPNATHLILCVAFTLFWARIVALFANRASAKTLNYAIGIVLTVLGAAILIVTLAK